MVTTKVKAEGWTSSVPLLKAYTAPASSEWDWDKEEWDKEVEEAKSHPQSCLLPSLTSTRSLKVLKV